MMWMLAHNILSTYVASFACNAGLADRVDVLLVFGAAAPEGIGVAGKLVGRHLRSTALVSLGTFFLALQVMARSRALPCCGEAYGQLAAY
ncbi:hypothetical protein [Stenotrophomonas sp. 57]|uniref:hypothetical protein n=1 Tax=Stenotrophomonas sp. 57 TaxID=3051119 RepID=UPI00256ECD2C|nr:hypothetical protein [Stenotrophomonas sp. 57]